MIIEFPTDKVRDKKKKNQQKPDPELNLEALRFLNDRLDKAKGSSKNKMQNEFKEEMVLQIKTALAQTDVLFNSCMNATNYEIAQKTLDAKLGFLVNYMVNNNI